jgi:hypothetical protein
MKTNISSNSRKTARRFNASVLTAAVAAVLAMSYAGSSNYKIEA